jgi:chromate reductase
MRIVGIAGSLRRASYNRALLRAAMDAAPDGVQVVTFDEIGAIPWFDEDLEASGTPALVEELRRAIAEADALVVVTPEYNSGTSGVLKNALDWASRGPVRVLAGKPVAVLGASTGRGGAQGGIESIVGVLKRTRSDVLDHPVAVPFAANAFDADLRLVDPRVSDEVRRLMGELTERAGAAVPMAA